MNFLHSSTAAASAAVASYFPPNSDYFELSVKRRELDRRLKDLQNRQLNRESDNGILGEVTKRSAAQRLEFLRRKREAAANTGEFNENEYDYNKYNLEQRIREQRAEELLLKAKNDYLNTMKLLEPQYLLELNRQKQLKSIELDHKMNELKMNYEIKQKIMMEEQKINEEIAEKQRRIQQMREENGRQQEIPINSAQHQLKQQKEKATNSQPPPMEEKQQIPTVRAINPIQPAVSHRAVVPAPNSSLPLSSSELVDAYLSGSLDSSYEPQPNEIELKQSQLKVLSRQADEMNRERIRHEDAEYDQRLNKLISAAENEDADFREEAAELSRARRKKIEEKEKLLTEKRKKEILERSQIDLDFTRSSRNHSNAADSSNDDPEPPRLDEEFKRSAPSTNSSTSAAPLSPTLPPRRASTISMQLSPQSSPATNDYLRKLKEESEIAKAEHDRNMEKLEKSKPSTTVETKEIHPKHIPTISSADNSGSASPRELPVDSSDLSISELSDSESQNSRRTQKTAAAAADSEAETKRRKQVEEAEKQKKIDEEKEKQRKEIELQEAAQREKAKAEAAKIAAAEELKAKKAAEEAAAALAAEKEKLRKLLEAEEEKRRLAEANRIAAEKEQLIAAEKERALKAEQESARLRQLESARLAELEKQRKVEEEFLMEKQRKEEAEKLKLDEENRKKREAEETKRKEKLAADKKRVENEAAAAAEIERIESSKLTNQKKSKSKFSLGNLLSFGSKGKKDNEEGSDSEDEKKGKKSNTAATAAGSGKSTPVQPPILTRPVSMPHQSNNKKPQNPAATKDSDSSDEESKAKGPAKPELSSAMLIKKPALPPSKSRLVTGGGSNWQQNFLDDLGGDDLEPVLASAATGRKTAVADDEEFGF